ncbi:CAP-Gly domain-containing linker protein 1 [Thalassophryne amazonica]|uniref:CAP-Gly domain-containing linker protein 1 n=1 Tax=Thalassophryne amazonica TaxID=390379 RepID=UPI001470B664|nr:CAP-Gly domain-containing linker protein 1 [Thalassophryne amazonica]
MTAKHRKGKANHKQEDNFLKNELLEPEVRPGGSNSALLLVVVVVTVLGGVTGVYFCFQQHQTLNDLTDSVMNMQAKIAKLQSSHEEMRMLSIKQHTSESLESRLNHLEDSYALAQKQVGIALATAEQLKTSDLPAQVLSLHTEMKSRLAEMQQATVSLEQLSQLQTLLKGKSEEFEDISLQVEGLAAFSTQLSQKVEVLIGSLGEAEMELEERGSQVDTLSATLDEQTSEVHRLKEQMKTYQSEGGQLSPITTDIIIGLIFTLCTLPDLELVEKEKLQQLQEANVEEQLRTVRQSLQDQNLTVQSLHTELTAQLDNIQNQITQTVLGGVTGVYFCFQQHQTLNDLTDSVMNMQAKIAKLQSSHEEMRMLSIKQHTSESLESRLNHLEDSYALAQKQVGIALATAEQLKTSDLPAQVLSLHTEMKSRLAEMQQATVSLEQLSQLQTLLKGKSEEFEDISLQVEGLAAFSTQLSQKVEVLIGSLGEAEMELEERGSQVDTLSATLDEQTSEVHRLKEQMKTYQSELEASSVPLATVRELVEKEKLQQLQEANVEEQLRTVRQSLQDQNLTVQSLHTELTAQLDNIQNQITQLVGQTQPLDEPVEQREEQTAPMDQEEISPTTEEEEEALPTSAEKEETTADEDEADPEEQARTDEEEDSVTEHSTPVDVVRQDQRAQEQHQSTEEEIPEIDMVDQVLQMGEKNLQEDEVEESEGQNIMENSTVRQEATTEREETLEDESEREEGQEESPVREETTSEHERTLEESPEDTEDRKAEEEVISKRVEGLEESPEEEEDDRREEERESNGVMGQREKQAKRKNLKVKKKVALDWDSKLQDLINEETNGEEEESEAFDWEEEDEPLDDGDDDDAFPEDE